RSIVPASWKSSELKTPSTSCTSCSRIAIELPPNLQPYLRTSVFLRRQICGFQPSGGQLSILTAPSIECTLAVAQPQGRTMSIHLLEDDAGVNESLALLLTHFNLHVIRHGSAESLFRAQPPSADDIVFVDLKLPGVSGAQTIRWLQSLKQPPHIVVISGQSQATI